MIDALRKAFGNQVADANPASGCVAVVRPKDVAAACELVRFSRDHSQHLIPVAGGTKRHWTDLASEPYIGMDMRGCARVVEYSPDDMTVTVEAGITLAALSAVLAEHRQRLTLDPPNADRATIGGILAANDSGPIRLAFGTARDVVIGMSMIEPDGTLFKSGGKVVKNVAGYDLHKLYIGSFGTLGPIATVTFKLRPIPEARGLVMLYPRDAGDAERMIAAALAGPTRPTMIELLNARMARSLVPGPSSLAPLLVIGFEENADAVRWQCEQMVNSFGGETLSEADARSVYERLREAAGAPVETSFKATLLSSHVAGFIECVDQWPIRVISRAGNGIVYGLLDEPIAESAWRELEAEAAAGEGNLQIRGKLPGSFVHRFGRPRADAHLSKGVQVAFDPAGTFAPQRLAT